MDSGSVLKGFQGKAKILKSAVPSKHEINDKGEPAIIQVPAIVLSCIDKGKFQTIETATMIADLHDAIVITEDTYDASTTSAILNLRVLANILGLDLADVPACLFRDAIEAECTRHPSLCPSHFPYKKAQFHVHFGLGRIAIGLVLPALNAGAARFTVLQRCSHWWKTLIECPSPQPLDLRINGESCIPPLQLAFDETHLRAVMCERGPSLVISNDEGMIRAVVKSATSFSSSLGVAIADVLTPILKHLDDTKAENRPILFACENDFGPVRDLSEQIGQKVNVVECMVDRVCTSRHIDAKTSSVDVEAEPWTGRIVVLEPLDPRLVPFGGNTTIPSDSKTARFLYTQKFQMVNGAHGVMGFITLRENGVTQKSVLGVMKETKMALMKLEGASKKCRDEFKTWQILRCTYLLWKFEIQVIANATGVEEDTEKVFQALLDMALQTEERISNLDDYVSRVMENQPPRMFAQRLLPLQEFISQLDISQYPCIKHFLEQSKIDFLESKQTIDALCAYASEISKGFELHIAQVQDNDDNTNEISKQDVPAPIH